MKPAHSLRRFLAAAIILSVSAAAAAETPGVQDINRKWAVIERLFIEGAHESSGVLFDELDAFSNMVREFQHSELFRVYRLVPFSGDSNPAFAPAPPNEIAEIRTIAGLAPDFRDAVVAGDREKALGISLDINDALASWLERDKEANQFSSNAHFWLFFVFIGFVFFMSVSFYFLYQALERSLRREAEQSVLTRAFLIAQEEERARISRELHDSIAQDLRYLSLGMDIISRTEDGAGREKLCNEAAAVQNTLIKKVRDICDNLIPPDFSLAGLPDALRRLCHDFGKRTGIDCRAEIMNDIHPDFLSGEKKLQIFRIVQEALTNVEKHANAGEAIVVLHRGMQPDAGDLFISISDDGKGFVPAEASAEAVAEAVAEAAVHASSDKQPHFGIRGMERRASLLGANLEIKSGAGEGTMVRLQIPLNEYLHKEAKNETKSENAVSGTPRRRSPVDQ